MNRLYLVFLLSLLAVFAGCDSSQVDDPLDLSAEENFSSSSFSSSNASSSSDALSSSVSSSSAVSNSKPRAMLIDMDQLMQLERSGAFR